MSISFRMNIFVALIIPRSVRTFCAFNFVPRIIYATTCICVYVYIYIYIYFFFAPLHLPCPTRLLSRIKFTSFDLFREFIERTLNGIIDRVHVR